MLIRLKAIYFLVIAEELNYLGKFSTLFFVYNYFMEFLNELWYNDQTTVIGIGVAVLVFIGIYINLLKTYQ